MPTDSGTNDILSLGFLHYTTAVSREMSDEPKLNREAIRLHSVLVHKAGIRLPYTLRTTSCTKPEILAAFYP